MCEIAVVDPEQAGIAAINQIAYKFHQEQGDGLGVLTIENKTDSFEYDYYRSTDPHWQTLSSFLSRRAGDAWRVVIHGRYGTVGGVNREHCHPLNIDCSECEFDYVIHNGSVNNHQTRTAGLTSNNHAFQTDVDSEVIAHTVSELPDTVENHDKDTYTLRGKLNYLLFSEDGILVRAKRKYDLTDRFTMTCSRRDFENAEDLGFERAKNEWMLISPAEDEPEIETKERQYSTAYSGGANTQTTWPSAGNSVSEQSSGETVTIEYDDLCPNYDEVQCIKVAPDVLYLRDKHADVSEYIYRDHEPKLFYYYSDESVPDNIDYLQELADERFPDEEQETLDDLIGDEEPDKQEGNVNEATAEASARTIADVVDEADNHDLREKMIENFKEGQERADTTGD